MTDAAPPPAPLRMTIPEISAFMTDLDNALHRSGDKSYPGTAHVALPKVDLERIGAIRRFFETISPYADDIRQLVARRMQGR